MILKNSKGITLIEIIVSVAILGIIMIPLSSLFVTAVKNNAIARNKMIANQLAQKYMEQVMLDIKQNGSYTIGSPWIDNGFETTVVINTNETYKVATESGGPDIGNLYTEIEHQKLNTLKQILVEQTEGKLINEDLSEIGLGTHGIHNPIKMKLQCKGMLDKTIDVSNTSGKPVEIYKVYSKEGKDKININTTEGEVCIFENIYDSSNESPDKNCVYKIKIVVKKGTKKLVEIVSYKTND